MTSGTRGATHMTNLTQCNMGKLVVHAPHLVARTSERTYVGKGRDLRVNIYNLSQKVGHVDQC